jgi:hypothetical protein
MKQIEWMHSDKMLLESGHKTFNRQTNLITYGNVIANTMYGRFIRPFTETECNGYTREPGHLQKFDLDWYTLIGRQPAVPKTVYKMVRELAQQNQIILYQFHHWTTRRGRSFKIVHGYVITSPDKKLLWYWPCGPTYKSEQVLLEAIKYITESEDDRAEH